MLTEEIAASELCDPSSPGLHWTTSNLGEAIPGIQTPLSQSIWSHTIDWASHRTAYEIGVMRRRENGADFPAPLDSPLIRFFYGRSAFQLEYFVLVGNRMPGTSGEEVCESIIGFVPEDIEFEPTRRRYASVGWRYPLVFAANPRRVRRAAAEGTAWCESHLARLPDLDAAGAAAEFAVAADRFKRAVSLQATTLLASITPLWQQISSIAERTGIGDPAVFSGTGGAEADLVRDIWRASRGELELEAVRARHGYHGPTEGELSSSTWREDPAPLREMVERYAAEPDSADPVALEERSRAERERLVREVLAATPRLRRPAVRATLALAATRIPLRGVAKETFLQAFDGARAAARRAGECLAADGVLEERDDVFFLTGAELADPPRDARDRVRERRELHEECRNWSLPSEFVGVPEGRPASDRATEPAPDAIEGVGVSSGVAEGPARVLTEPDFGEVEPGEILVAPFTDPGWASIMFVSSALVVDIGGALSHAAVVARELGIPCVVSTEIGTRALRTGDRVRVDGAEGTVEVLQRAAAMNGS